MFYDFIINYDHVPSRLNWELTALSSSASSLPQSEQEDDIIINDLPALGDTRPHLYGFQQIHKFVPFWVADNP